MVSLVRPARHAGAAAPRAGRRGWRALAGRGQRGAATIEFMISFVLLSALIAFLVQGAMYMYAHNVIMGAVQDGARVAAAYNGTLDGGIGHAQALARDGLGGYADGIAIGGREGGGLVIVEARGEMPLLVPGLAGRRIPLDALAVMEKERFRVRESRP